MEEVVINQTNNTDNTNVSVDHQQLIVAGLIQNTYMLSLISSEMNESYFSDASCRIIYKSLLDYYEKYNKAPTEVEIKSMIDANYINLGPSKDKVKSTAGMLYKLDEIDESYLTTKCVELIRKVRTSRTLSKTLEAIKNGASLNEEKLTTDLIDSLDIHIEKSTIFNLSDKSRLPDIRKKAVGEGNSKVIKSTINDINLALQYRGYQIGTLNLIVAPPSIGKTSYLVNEGAYAAQQGYNVAHFFLGDMFEYDGFIRYTSCISGRLQNDVAAMSELEQEALIDELNTTFSGVLNRCDTASYASGEKTVDEVIEIIKQQQDKTGKHYDMIIIDYADNFAKNGDNMYLEGGIIYDRLALFGRINQSVMMVASQPKIQYWGEEIIPLEGAAESSKKQHIVDLMVTFNKRAKGLNFGTMHIAKMRRGIGGGIIRVKTHWENCRVEQITEDDYKQLCVDNGIV